MGSVWAVFLLLVGGSEATNYIKLTATWGQEIWEKYVMHYVTILFILPLVKTSSSSLQPHTELEVSSHTALKTYCLKDRSVCEVICFQASFSTSAVTYLSNYVYLCFHCRCGSSRSTIFPKYCAFYLFNFSKDMYLLKLAKAWQCLFICYLHKSLDLSSSSHFLTLVKRNLSPASEASFEKQLLCVENH